MEREQYGSRGAFVQNAILNQINVNHLKIFEKVYRLKSMTLAAQQLFLTQSGISQHIKKLENDLGVTLFVRDRSELFPTSKADELFRVCEKAFRDLSSALAQMQDSHEQELSGIIRLGIPTEFGNNVILPSVAKWSKLHSKVKFEFVYGYGNHLIEQLLSNQLDVAFVDAVKLPRSVNTKAIFEESLSLVVSKDYLKKRNIILQSQKEKLATLIELDFLEYEKRESILRMWLQHHYGKKNIPLNIRAWAMNVQGVATLLKQDMGAAVLPDHVIEKLEKEGARLHRFKGARDGMKNRVSLIWIRKKPLTRAVLELKDFLIKEIKS